MIKQIKPHSLSHKFLSLIFEKHEIRRGINICDVPWRALKQLITFMIVSAVCIVGAVTLLTMALGVVLAFLSPFFQYSVKFAELAGVCWVFACMIVFSLAIAFVIIWFTGDIELLPAYLKKQSSDKPSPPSLISIWWKSFKEKTCVKIVVDSEAMMEGK